MKYEQTRLNWCTPHGEKYGIKRMRFVPNRSSPLGLVHWSRTNQRSKCKIGSTKGERKRSPFYDSAPSARVNSHCICVLAKQMPFPVSMQKEVPGCNEQSSIQSESLREMRRSMNIQANVKKILAGREDVCYCVTDLL